MYESTKNKAGVYPDQIKHALMFVSAKKNERSKWHLKLNHVMDESLNKTVKQLSTFNGVTLNRAQCKGCMEGK